jgi:hypothetical protein
MSDESSSWSTIRKGTKRLQSKDRIRTMHTWPVIENLNSNDSIQSGKNFKTIYLVKDEGVGYEDRMVGVSWVRIR